MKYLKFIYGKKKLKSKIKTLFYSTNLINVPINHHLKSTQQNHDASLWWIQNLQSSVYCILLRLWPLIATVLTGECIDL